MDPIADMMNSLKLGAKAGKPSVLVPYSKVKEGIAKILEQEKYLKRVTQLGKKNRKYLECFLAYENGAARLSDVKRVSKPSRRVYVGAQKLHPVKSGRGLAIISTPKGLLVDKEAKIGQVGGELLLEVW